MVVTYTWLIEQLECAPTVGTETDVVTNVHWRLNGVDGVHNGSVYGEVSVPPPTGSFTPYAQLTHDQIVGWVQTALGADKATTYQNSVASQIAAQIAPATITPPLPWAV